MQRLSGSRLQWVSIISAGICISLLVIRASGEGPGLGETDPSAIGSDYEKEVPDTLDLAERARLGAGHLTSIIEPEEDYEMYWGVQPLSFPSNILAYIGFGDQPKLGCAFGEYNPPYLVMWWSMLHACQPKCMEALAMMRLMCGDRRNLDLETKMLQVLASYIDEDGIFYVPADPEKTWLGPPENRPHANLHGQGRMMRAMIAWYQYSGNPAWKDLIDRMVVGLDKIAVHKDDYAYYPFEGWIPIEYFRSSYLEDRGWKDTRESTHEKDGEEGSLFNQQGHIPGPLATWYKLTGNKKALDLSGKLVRFYTKPKFWADWEGGEYPGVAGAEHAHFRGHLHGHVNTLRAILEYALVTRDTRLMQFVRDGYEWARQMEISRIGLVGDGQGCGCGRMIGLAVKLSLAGIGDYWEDVDLYIRNHGVEMQLTEEDVPFLNKLAEGKPAPPTHNGMSTENVVERCVGAFSNHVPPYKTSTSGCCTPHGLMGLFYAWDGTLQFEDGVATINLLLNRASPWMDIQSYLPYEGKVTLENKQAKEVFLRMPLWVDRGAIRCNINGTPIDKFNWFGSYIRIGDLKGGEIIVFVFPVKEWTEEWTKPKHGPFLITAIPESTKFTFRMRGNTVVEVTPPLMDGSPLYRARPEKYRNEKAPTRLVNRFVSETRLVW